MSDKDLPAETGDDGTIAEPEPEATSGEDAQFAEAKSAATTRSGGAVAWLALLVAVVALAWLAFDFVRGTGTGTGGEETQSATDIAALQSTVRTIRDSLASLEQSVAALSTLDNTRNAEMDALRRQFEERIREFDALPGRVINLEGTVSSLQGISTGARDAWLLAEAEYYMQIANAQLQLAGNPRLAAMALTLADERILQLADPGLVEVRRALADELRALDAMEKPDTEGITLQLASLAEAVDELPLQNEIMLADEGGAGIDPELTGTDRAMASLRNALGDVVSIRRTDETLQPLLAPEAQYFLRANLALQFQAARLAVLRNDEAIFAQSMDDAAAWLETHYDTQNEAVQSALQAIAGMRGSTFTVAVPDISASLRLLRQFDAFARVADDRAAGPESDDEQPVEPPPEEPQE